VTAVEVIRARHGLPRLAARLHELGTRRALILVGPSRRFADEVAAALGVPTVIFDGARVHVPAEVVDSAAQALVESEADTIVAVGGGSTIGLGKALRLGHHPRFVAIPTTYAGSEMTTIYGITRGAEKTTGRDGRVRPDLVLYDPTLSATLPAGITVQSLMNALAHIVSVLSTGSLPRDGHGDGARAQALDTAGVLVRVMEDLLLAPGDLAARELALEAAAAAGVTYDRGKSGAQHQLAHRLGGALGLDHAALHAVLLPQFLAHLRERDAALVTELEAAIGVRDLETHLHDLLVRAGVPTSLDGLGAEPAAVKMALGTRPELPAAIALDAQHGLRPTGKAGRLRLGPGPLALLAGPRPERARRVVLTLHGRGAEAGGIVRRLREIVGHDPEVAVIGLRTEGNRWYTMRYGDPGASADAEVAQALAQVAAALAELSGPLGVPPERTVLAGFSQGGCVALEHLARTGGPLAAVIAPCAGRIGPPEEWSSAVPDGLAALPILLGAGATDPWVSGPHLETTAAWFRAAGAAVEVIGSPGDRHDISTRQRLRARELIRGAPAAPGPTGFGNHLASEALPGALPARQNSPRRAPFGLYPEQLSGTGFTARRAENLRTWVYRIRPSSQRRAFAPLKHPRFAPAFEGRPPEINLVGFAPLPVPTGAADFVDGLVTLGGAGSAASRRGYAVHVYSADRDMERRAFYDADGDLLLIPESGALTLMTELGPLAAAPGQIAILPRGLLFSVHLHGPLARGYLAETYGRHLQLPERGPVGANSLVDPRHFHAPAAWYEDKLAPEFRITAKLGGRLHDASQDHSPYDVVAWHGSYLPWVYDLADFSPVANVRFDHIDPSVYTVISSPLDEPGTSTLDLIAFLPRWDVTEGTFRPPFFHRNVTTEVNGIVRENPPPGSRFQPGCVFVTPAMTAHGASGRAVERARAQHDVDADRPVPPGDAIWFQLESTLPFSLTPWADEARVPDWPATWGSHRSYFDPNARGG
jgi:homogentisate 1,2-dioxygenase